MSFKVIKKEPQLLENFQKVCRLCLSGELLEDIFKQDDLILWIADFLSIVVSKDDQISQSICAICQARLNEFRDFQLMCHEVQDVLQGSVISRDVYLNKENDVKPELTIDTEKKFLPIVPDAGNKTAADDEKLQNPVHLNQQIILNKSGRKRYIYNEREAYENQKIECPICGDKVHESRMEGHQNRHKGIQPFKCERDCENVAFYCRETQQCHYRNYHGEKPHKCDICNKCYSSKKVLQFHTKDVHSSETHICSICSHKSSSRSGLYFHMKIHNLEMYENEKQTQKNNLVEKQDSLETTKVKVEPFTDSVETQDELQDASCSAVEGQLSLFEAEEVKIEPDSDPEQGQDYSAAKEGLSLLQAEEAMVSDHTIDVKKELQPTVHDAEAVLKPTKRRVKRRECKNRLVKSNIYDKNIHPYRVQNHQILPKDLQPFKCKRGCDNVVFYSQVNQKHHYQLVHSKPQECDICHKSYPTKQSLSSHKWGVHSQKKIGCPLCDNKAFTTISRLKKHIKIHNREDKQYSCSICSISFAFKRNLNRHLKIHKNVIATPTNQSSMDCDPNIKISDDIEIPVLPAKPSY